MLYGKRKWLEIMPPFNGGGEMIGEVTLDTVTYAAPPHRFEAGTPPIVEAIGLGAALDYMMRIGRADIRAHEETLRDYAQERLSRINSLRIFGEAPGKGAIISFEMKNAHAHDVATVIDRLGRRGSGRYPLRPAASCAIWRDIDVPGLVRSLQYRRGGRRPGRGACQGPGHVRLTEGAMADGSTTDVQPDAPLAAASPLCRPRRSIA